MNSPPQEQSQFLRLREPVSTLRSTSGFDASLSGSNRSPTSYQPTTGHDPYEHPKSDDKRKLIAAELKGFWTEERLIEPKPNRTLWNTFFPDKDDSKRCLEALKRDGYYGDVDRRSAVRPNGRRESIHKGWIHIPKVPQNDEMLLEKQITAAFVPILNHIIATLNMSDTQVAVDGQEFLIRTRDNGWLKPDVFLWGKGSSAFAPVVGKPKVKPDPRLQKKPQKKWQGGTQKLQRKPKTQIATQPDQAADARPPDIDWLWCRVPIEVKTASDRGSPANKHPSIQLGAYVREVFAAQTNRRFVPSLIITECAVEFLLWDRGGPVVTVPLDYHNEPLPFCNMLTSLVQWDDDQLGFDPTISYHEEDPRLYIRTQEQDEYVVEETLFRSYTLQGRGSTCWRVRKLKDNTDAKYIIIDSWVKDGSSGEHTILRKIQDAGVATGVASLAHIENVQWQSSEPNYFYKDTIQNNRRGFVTDVNLVHTRTVLHCHMHGCVPLLRFMTPKDLVYALRDVIKGLGEIHDKVGIVHRDITPWNILIQHGASEGSRGILIDFSCATFANPEASSPRLEKTPGSYFFASHKVLEGKLSNSHLDELESIYWILVFIVSLHDRLDASLLRMASPTAIRVIEALEGDAAAGASAKKGYLKADFVIPVLDWSGQPVKKLVEDFHVFLQSRLKAGKTGKVLQVDANDDYRTVVGYFHQAIRELESPVAIVNFLEGCAKPLDVGRNVREDSDSDDSTRVRKRIRLGMTMELEGEPDSIVFDLAVGEIEF